jgi:PST family polysaccharide transporter
MSPRDDAQGDRKAELMLQSVSSKEARFLRLTQFHVDSDLKKRTVRGLTSSLIGEGINFFLRVGSMAILARMLVPEYFGLITMVMVVTTVVERLKDLGLTTATIQRQSLTHEEVSTLFWINAAGGVVMAVLVAACAGPLALFYNEPRLIPITLVFATTFILSSLAIQHQALLNRQMRYARVAATTISAEVISLAIAVVLALNGAGYWALVAREAFRSVIYTAATWICIPWIPSRPSRNAKVTSMLSFGGDVTAFNLVYFLCTNVDKIIIGRLMGPAPLGVYRQGSQLAVLPATQITYPVNNVAQSILSRLQNDPEKYIRSYCKLVTALSAVTMPLMMFLAVFATETVVVAFGIEWIAAANILKILALALFIDPASSIAGSVMLTCGKSRRYMYLGIVSSVTMMVLFLAGTPWGSEGIALGRVAYSYLFLLPYLWWSFKDTPVNLRHFGNAIARPLLSSLLMGEVLYLLKSWISFDREIFTLMVGGLLMVPLYVGFWLVLPRGRSEIRQVWTDLTAAFSQSKGGAT